MNLDATSKQHYKEVQHLMSWEMGFVTYRAALRHAKGSNLPYIPNLGKELTDLTFLEEGSWSGILQGGLINVKKLIKSGEIIQDLFCFRYCQYKFVVDPTLQNYLKNTNVLSKEEVWEMSLKVEPK